MKLSQTKQFKKDITCQIKQGKHQRILTSLVGVLLLGESPPPKNQDHPRKGAWKGRRDCHIEPDWILIYRRTEDELRLERTGSHGDLF